MSKCNASCPNRQVGCRSGCAIWAEHEALKAIRYVANKKEFDASYTRPMAIAGIRKKTNDYKQGRRVSR